MKQMHADLLYKGYSLKTGAAKMDVAVIHAFLCHQSYWAKGIPLETVQKSLRNSVCFGVFLQGRQVAFARVVTDSATFAYLADVFVLPDERGKGLSKWLLQAVLRHKRLQGIRRWLLITKDAHGLYTQMGFTPVTDAGRFMERYVPEVYSSDARV